MIRARDERGKSAQVCPLCGKKLAPERAAYERHLAEAHSPELKRAPAG